MPWSLPHCLIVWLIFAWLILYDSLSLTHYLSDSLFVWLIIHLINYLHGYLSVWLKICWTHYLSDFMYVCLIRLTCYRTNSISVWLSICRTHYIYDSSNNVIFGNFVFTVTLVLNFHKVWLHYCNSASLTAWLPACMTSWLPDCLPACLTAWLSAHMNDWLLAYINDWLPACLTAWLPACLTAWREEYIFTFSFSSSLMVALKRSSMTTSNWDSWNYQYRLCSLQIIQA